MIFLEIAFIFILGVLLFLILIIGLGDIYPNGLLGRLHKQFFAFLINKG